jgi:acyl CoA:acetate/3-ketoacid CoA transferase beta subunit
MTHTAKGAAKIVPQCDLPLTATRPVSLIVTEMAVIEPRADGLWLRETAPGVSVEEIRAATLAPLIVEGQVPEMQLGQ